MSVQFTDDVTRPIFYQYRPSQSAGYAFVALFGITTIAHFGLMIWTRAWFFIPLVIGGVCEAFGYYGRAWSHDDPSSIKPWVLQNMLILAAPPFIAATVYMTLKRIIVALEAEKHAMIGPRWVAKLYVFIDIICFCSQIAGVGLQATGDENVIETGTHVILAGLILQLVAFVLFIFMSWRLQKRLGSDPTDISGHPQFRWQRHIRALYLVSLAILVRSLVRAIEFSQGPTGTVNSSEVYLYLFDGCLMLIVLTTYLVVHPGRLIRATKHRKEFIDQTLMEERPYREYESLTRDEQQLGNG